MGADLAIDTASERGAVAVLDGERVLAEHVWRLESTFSKELLAAVDRVLTDAGVGRDAITSIAVDAGPGGYSGLRTGVATAQGLALALDLPLAGVSRLEAAAFPHLDGATSVIAVHDARRGRIAWAAYAAGARGEPPVELVAPRIDEAAACVDAAPAGARWCGEIGDELRAARAAAERGGDTEVDAAENVRHAADLVRLARLHEAYGDPAAVDVVYLRPPPITRPKGVALAQRDAAQETQLPREGRTWSER